MATFRTRPFQENEARNDVANERRKVASTYASRYAALPTERNSDEIELQGEGFSASFTKGLPHDELGQLISDDDYIVLVNQINQQDADSFDAVARGLDANHPARTRRKDGSGDGSDIQWRGWESPRAGHYFDLQGPRCRCGRHATGTGTRLGGIVGGDGRGLCAGAAARHTVLTDQ